PTSSSTRGPGTPRKATSCSILLPTRARRRSREGRGSSWDSRPTPTSRRIRTACGTGVGHTASTDWRPFPPAHAIRRSPDGSTDVLVSSKLKHIAVGSGLVSFLGGRNAPFCHRANAEGAQAAVQGAGRMENLLEGAQIPRAWRLPHLMEQ